MPDVAIILLMLAVLWWGTLCTVYTLKRMHRRCDEIATGFVNGLPVSLKYRWLLLFQDYVGMAFALVFVLAAVAVGFLAAKETVDDSSVGNVALLCGIVAGWAALAILVFVVAWVFDLTSVLRQASEECAKRIHADGKAPASHPQIRPRRRRPVLQGISPIARRSCAFAIRIPIDESTRSTCARMSSAWDCRRSVVLTIPAWSCLRLTR